MGSRRLDNNTDVESNYEILVRLSSDMTGVVVSDPAYSVEYRNTDVCTECFTAFEEGLPDGYDALAITTDSDRVTEAED